MMLDDAPAPMINGRVPRPGEVWSYATPAGAFVEVVLRIRSTGHGGALELVEWLSWWVSSRVDATGNWPTRRLPEGNLCRFVRSMTADEEINFVRLSLIYEERE